MRNKDRLALELALDQFRHEPDREEQVSRILATEGWHSAARLASFSRQMDSLGLKPWQVPPCYIDRDDPDAGLSSAPNIDGRHEAAKLLREMLAAGVSRFDPDPLKAIAAKKAVQANKGAAA